MWDPRWYGLMESILPEGWSLPGETICRGNSWGRRGRGNLPFRISSVNIKICSHLSHLIFQTKGWFFGSSLKNMLDVRQKFVKYLRISNWNIVFCFLYLISLSCFKEWETWICRSSAWEAGGDNQEPGGFLHENCHHILQGPGAQDHHVPHGQWCQGIHQWWAFGQLIFHWGHGRTYYKIGTFVWFLFP